MKLSPTLLGINEHMTTADASTIGRPSRDILSGDVLKWIRTVDRPSTTWSPREMLVTRRFPSGTTGCNFPTGICVLLEVVNIMSYRVEARMDKLSHQRFGMKSIEE